MKLKDQEEPIVYKVQLLEELIERQSRLLVTANDIIDMKTRLIKLCEQEVDIYRAENKRLGRSLLFCGALLILSTVLSLIHLLS
jgi:hypothetical protein